MDQQEFVKQLEQLTKRVEELQNTQTHERKTTFKIIREYISNAEAQYRDSVFRYNFLEKQLDEEEDKKVKLEGVIIGLGQLLEGYEQKINEKK